MIITSFYTLVLLTLLIGILIYIEIFYYPKIHNKRQRQIFLEELDSVMLATLDKKNLKLKKILFFCGLFFLAIASSDPRWGKKSEENEKPDLITEGIDIVIAVDVSKSMLANDIKPNRLENAKTALKLLLGTDLLAGNRVGLVAFAGSSFIQCPLTTDINAIGAFVDELKPDLIPIPGTDIGGAIRSCLKAFGEAMGGGQSRAIILITDGEDNEKNAISASEEAAQQGVRIFTLGIGSALGETLPEVDENGNIIGVKRDKKGNIVISRLDTELLKNIAQKTSGNYYIVDSDTTGKTSTNSISSALSGIFSAISSLPKHKIKFHLSPAYGYKERFQIFTLMGILCLVGEFILSERKNEKKRDETI